ncbi:MAG: feoB [Myxococcaceae bacterium]|nr:feoB [Myxococcaceae bacterium]
MTVIGIVGTPNVGKSVMFNNLTGRYATVSNYPGTTVEVSRGRTRLAGGDVEVVDTPGMYSLLPITDEERVARKMLLDREPQVVIHMVDAKNLERLLPQFLQLRELGMEVVLVLNLMDEARKLGVELDVPALRKRLGVSVVESIATSGVGVPELKEALALRLRTPGPAAAPLGYDPALEQAIHQVSVRLPMSFAGSERGVALLLLQDDAEVAERVKAATGAGWDEIRAVIAQAQQDGEPPQYRIALARQAEAQAIAQACVRVPRSRTRTFADRFAAAAIHPLTGAPMLAVILYFGLYQFVGVFGAGKVVDFLENDLFGTYVTPAFDAFLLRLLPAADGWQYWTRELFGGEFGMITLGVTYAMAIVLPIVCLFFLFFSILEDSGYFPRLALLVDALFKRIGLNGRAVIPLVLGLGCDTMATMVTRIQETKKERIITTLLLALAVPCSAQYGVITALLVRQPNGVLGMSYAWLAWASILAVMFVGVGMLASKLVKGEEASFYMELPPMRLPKLSNVVVKTAARMKWYFLEVLPLFLFASLLIWVGRLTHLFDALIAGLVPVVGALGLPSGTAPAFLYGFFRRDFGAAGLYSMADTGALSGNQLLVSCVTLTLFLPCVAQFLIMKKERGLKMALAMSGGIVVTAFAVGATVNAVLVATGISL